MSRIQPFAISLASLFCMLGLMFSALTGPGFGQDPGDDGRPLEDPAYDDNAVDLVSGTGDIYSPAISIGSPGAGGLSYAMVFRDGSWRHSFMGGIDTDGSNAVFVWLGGSGETFSKSGSTYTNINGSGTTLTYNTTTGIYTYTLRDGTLVEYNEDYIGTLTSVSYGSDVALIDEITYPNGDQTYYDWMNTFYEQCPPGEEDPNLGGGLGGGLGDPGCFQVGLFWRLDSVRTNRGYQIHIEYERDDMTIGPDYLSFMTPVKVTGVNNTEHVCSIGAPCTPSGDWPTLEMTNVTSFSTAATFTEADGADTIFNLDADRRITSIQTPESTSANITYGYVSSGTYEGSVSSISSGGLTTSYSYAQSGGILTTTVTHPGGQTTKTEIVVSTGLVQASIDPGNNRTEFLYDSSGRVERVTNPEDDYVTYAYDGRGNVTSMTRYPKPGSSLSALTVSAVFPVSCSNPKTCNQPTSTTDAAGETTSYTYYSHGGVNVITAPRPTAGADRPQIKHYYGTRTAYYLSGPYSTSVSAAPTSVTLPTQLRRCRVGELSTCLSTANEHRTLFTYGRTGVANNLHTTQVQERLGDGTLNRSSTMTYTDWGDLQWANGPLSGAADSVFYRYDEKRRPVGLAGPDPDGSGPRRHAATRITYDLENRVVTRESGTVTSFTDPAWGAFNRLQRQTFEYDALGRPTIARAYDAGTTIEALVQYQYYATGNGKGQLECAALRMNPATFSSPPSSACSLGTTGTLGQDRITRVSYDSFGRAYTSTEGYGTTAAGITTETAFTTNGLVDWFEDGEGNRTDLQYDGFDRLIERNYPNASGGGVNWSDDEVFNYNAVGRLASRITRSNQTFTYTYDDLGRVSDVTAPSGTDSTSFTYDNFGNVLTVADGTDTITNTYNAMGLLLSQAQKHGTVSYQYDGIGRRTRLTYPDGFYVTYDWNPASQLTHIRENGATSGVGVLATFSYDDQGRRTKLAYGNGTETRYNFDAVGRLDALVQDLSGTADDNTDSFTYNPVGQIASRTRSNTGYSYASHINIDTLFGHNGLNEITSVTGSTAPTYDARGNMTSDGHNSFGFDQYNRLTSATVGTNTAVLDYDPMGRLETYTTLSGTDQDVVYDGIDMLVWEVSGSITRRWVHGPGTNEPLVEYTGSGTTNRAFLHADARGSIIAHTDSTGVQTASFAYDEYGNPAGSSFSTYGYTGHLYLAELGINHAHNRAYHPELMRFLQTDPIGVAGGINLYAYVGGDPVNFTDPLGLKKRKCTGTRIRQKNCDHMNYGTLLQLRARGLSSGAEIAGPARLGGGAIFTGSRTVTGTVYTDGARGGDYTYRFSYISSVAWPWSPRYPHDLRGTVFSFWVNDLESYLEFRREFREEFNFAVEILGSIPYESDHQAWEVLQEFHNLLSVEGRRAIMSWALGGVGPAAGYETLWAAQFPRISAVLSLAGFLDLVGGVDVATQRGLWWRHGPQFLNTDLSCEIVGRPLHPQHVLRYGRFQC